MVKSWLLMAQHTLAMLAFLGRCPSPSFEDPVRNPQRSGSLFVFSFSEVLAFHRHSRSLLGIFRYSAAASGAKLLLSPFSR